jgi:hypothetical protein
MTSDLQVVSIKYFRLIDKQTNKNKKKWTNKPNQNTKTQKQTKQTTNKTNTKTNRHKQIQTNISLNTVPQVIQIWCESYSYI